MTQGQSVTWTMSPSSPFNKKNNVADHHPKRKPLLSDFTRMTNVVKDRCYVRGSVVPFEEDLRHEFKGHRTITLQDRFSYK